MIWVAGRSPILVSQNLKATTLTYLAIQLESLPSVYGQLSHTPKSLKRLYWSWFSKYLAKTTETKNPSCRLGLFRNSKTIHISIDNCWEYLS